MDRKSILILVACGVAMLSWILLINKQYPPVPIPPRATNATPSTLIGTNLGTSSPPATVQPAAPSLVTVRKPIAATNTQEQLLVLSNQTARYTFSTHGGGIKLIELLRYPEPTSPHHDSLNAFNFAPTMALLEDGLVPEDGLFNLTLTNGGVRAEKTLTKGLTIIKDFQLTNSYLVTASVRLRNDSGHALSLPTQEWVVGTAQPLDARDNGQFVGVLWYDGVKPKDIPTDYSSGGCGGTLPSSDYRFTSSVVWAAAHNRFFALAAMPREPASGVVVRKIELPRPTGEEARLVATNAPLPIGYEAALLYPPLTLQTNEVASRQFFLYAGPKEYQTLARVADAFNNRVDQVMNFGWASLVSRALLLSMNWLHEVLRLPYGLAIVVITFIIKVLFWPLTQASTRSMKRMAALQKPMNEIKEKYKDDPAKMNRKMMEFMKEHKVSPLGGCLPMVLQIPVFFGFYSMIQSAIELRGAHFLWATDLSQRDTLFVIPGLGFVPFIGIAGVGLPFNLMPLIMGATMLWQSHLTPPSPGMDPTQAKMMRYMPLMFLVILYNYSAGLTLYWTVQNLLSIAQTMLTRTAPETVPTPPQPVRKR